MRILHVYSGNLYGGIETMLVTLARCRDLCPEMEPHFALCFEGRLSEELIEAGATVHILGGVRVSRPSSVRRARRALTELLEKIDFDRVVCHAPWSQAIFGTTARAANVPLVFWMHDAVDGKHWLQRWARRTPPDLAICNSHFTASTLRNLYSHVRAEVIHCPVALSQSHYSNGERHATRRELHTPEDATVIIQVSRMEKMKGHSFHLEALSMLADSPDWVCWMVGGAQRPHEIVYLKELKEITVRKGIADRVRFLGERTDVTRLLAAADIYCQPNIQPEGFGLTFIEALDAGLPIVTSALGGACEIVDGSCGMLVSPGDTGALATSLEKLIRDQTLRDALAAGRMRSQSLCEPASQLKKVNNALSLLSIGK